MSLTFAVLDALLGRVSRLMAGPDRVRDFTLEAGLGETYSGGLVLYGHGRYPRHSVLSGQDSRHWVASFADRAEADTAIAYLRRNLGRKFRFDDWAQDGSCGSSYVPVAQVVSHLPDDTDY